MSSLPTLTDAVPSSTDQSAQMGDLVIGLLIRAFGISTGLALLITSALVLL